MSYDLYVEFGGKTKQDIDTLVKGNLGGTKISDIFTRIQLLAGIATRNEGVKDYAVSGDRKRGGGYKSLVHKQDNPENTPYAKGSIVPALAQMKDLGLIYNTPDFTLLPSGSWSLQFTFTLAKPWLSKDDDLFYVTESVNPVRKDKVFKVPMMSAAAWKGLLRWTLMHIRLAQKRDDLDPQQFATERFVQTLLFGDEQGEEPGDAKGFAKHVNKLNSEARTEYERLLRGYFKVKPDEALPHHSGRLIFYPTFFDAIDVEVINPHSRETRAGTHPIYLECVPAGAKGAFTLLYVPFDLIGHSKEKIRQQIFADLQRVAEGLQAMFLTYGFGAKTSSGFGVAEDKVKNGRIQTNIPLIVQQAPRPQEPGKSQELLEFLQQFPDEDFSLKPNEWRKQRQATNTQRNQYKAARTALREYQEAQNAYKAELEKWEIQTKEPEQRYLEGHFEAFSDLISVVKGISQKIRIGGAV